MNRFYEYSFRRDEAFMDNLMGREDAGYDTSGTLVVVTGGFHTDNLLQMFRERNISHVSILPAFVNCPVNENPYFRILSGKPNGLAASLDASLSAIQVPSLWNALGTRADAADAELARIAVAALSHAEALGRGIAVLTTRGDYLVLRESGGVYRFSI